MQPPNVFKGLVGVLIKCWGECILGTCTGWVQLVCAISKKLGQKRKSFLVYFFDSNLLFFSSQPKHAVQAYTAELFLFLSVLLCCFCWNISTNVEAIEHSWPSNNESYWLWRSPDVNSSTTIRLTFEGFTHEVQLTRAGIVFLSLWK